MIEEGEMWFLVMNKKHYKNIVENKEFRLVLQQNNEGSFLGFCIMIYVFFWRRE